MGTWNHRVCLEDGGYSIREVFYNDEGEPWGAHMRPTAPYGDTKKELKAELKMMKRACKFPVLDLDNIEWTED